MTDEPYNESNPSTPRKIYAGQTVYDLLAAHGGTITFTATWRPQTIKVTWIAGAGGKVCVNGDEANQTTTLTKSYTTISPSIDIVRPVADEGYRFVEWRITDTGETLTTEALLKLVKDGEFWPLSQSFTAIFRPITYTIAFDYARGDDHQQLATGTLPGPISKTFGVEVRLPNILDMDGEIMLTRDGYVFAGWNTKADGTGKRYSINQLLNEDFTFTEGDTIYLYDMWTPSKYTVEFFHGATGVTGKMDKQTLTYDVTSFLNANEFIRNRLSLHPVGPRPTSILPSTPMVRL